MIQKEYILICKHNKLYRCSPDSIPKYCAIVVKIKGRPVHDPDGRLCLKYGMLARFRKRTCSHCSEDCKGTCIPG